MKCNQPELLKALKEELSADPNELEIEVFKGKENKWILKCNRCGQNVERTKYQKYSTCATCQKELMSERTKNRNKLGI